MIFPNKLEMSIMNDVQDSFLCNILKMYKIFKEYLKYLTNYIITVKVLKDKSKQFHL